MSAFLDLLPDRPRRLAVLGAGTVGRALLPRLAALEPTLSLCLLATSRWRCADPEGLPAGAALAAIALAQAGPDAAPDTVQAHDGSGDLPAWFGPGDVLVDATASEALAARHARWLQRGLRVVTANKLGVGGPLIRHQQVRRQVENGAWYGDAATVGAGLPLLRCVRDLRAGGDRVSALAGVLSGTLAWLFDGYDGSTPFSARVREAVALGYAEPDPRVDLSGEDVRRKLLILARAAGQPLDAGDVQVESLLTPALLGARDAASTDAALVSLDHALSVRARDAAARGNVLRYVARLDGAHARIGLESLPLGHALAQGGACDNRVAIWSCRYDQRPLVIQGPGAGAGVTAAALLDDIRRATT
ncbi:homoserine dehydrogenase [Arenimonas soli]|uniref:Homoserine dehydrogenase n=1 Tax=Arenimonas soli TaxID=2269504 RepID=A0ABQ1HQ30_9GAMM|nr:homoserine dehydrogenase [Arenimonas soli]GGA85852.1 homoserine dehydrogenase [Arenimonas soli]